MKRLSIFLSGMVMGMAETIPGISSGTVAFVLGIYDRFIKLISNVISFGKIILLSLTKIYKKETWSKIKKAFWKLDLEFAIFLGVGMVIAIGIFSNLFSFLLKEYPMHTFGVFFGMIIASIYSPISVINKTFRNLIIGIISFVIFYFLFGISGSDGNSSPSYLFIFIGGAVGISAMVLPGISGSFLLLSIGLYEYILSRVASIFSLELTTDTILPLIVFALGIVFGLVSIIKLLEYVLEQYKHVMLSLITGLILASLRVIWPFMDVNSGESAEYMKKLSPLDLPASQVLSVVLFMLMGFVVVTIFFWSKNSNKKKDTPEIM